MHKNRGSSPFNLDNPKSNFNATGIISCLVATEFLLELVRHEALVVLQVLLDVHLEFDDVVEHLLDLGV